jgi:hypothetical protein
LDGPIFRIQIGGVRVASVVAGFVISAIGPRPIALPVLKSGGVRVAGVAGFALPATGLRLGHRGGRR